MSDSQQLPLVKEGGALALSHFSFAIVQKSQFSWIIRLFWFSVPTPSLLFGQKESNRLARDFGGVEDGGELLNQRSVYTRVVKCVSVRLCWKERAAAMVWGFFFVCWVMFLILPPAASCSNISSALWRYRRTITSTCAPGNRWEATPGQSGQSLVGGYSGNP